MTDKLTEALQLDADHKAFNKQFPLDRYSQEERACIWLGFSSRQALSSPTPSDGRETLAFERVQNFIADYSKHKDAEYGLISCSEVERCADLWLDDLKTVMQARGQSRQVDGVDDGIGDSIKPACDETSSIKQSAVSLDKRCPVCGELGHTSCVMQSLQPCIRHARAQQPTDDGMLECIRELDAVLFMSMELGGSIFWGTEANKNQRAALRGFERRRTKARTLAAKFLKRGEGL